MRARVLVAGCAAGGVLLSGCATFAAEPPPESWESQRQLTPQAGPDPQVPGDAERSRPRPAQPTPSEVPPPNGCTDYDPAVIATCLDTVTAVAALPGDGSAPAALVGERTTGRIVRAQYGEKPQPVITLEVDATGDGGLTGLALSPTYAEDQLVFAYITTKTDNRLVRIAPGDKPEPVLTGIPRGRTGNRGALALDHRGALLLATGDAGNPTAADDPKSLAGKVLRLNVTGEAAQGNPTASSPIVASGLHAPGGVCSSLDGRMMWVTDRAPDSDVLYQIVPGKALGTPAWTWPDRPGVAGCTSTPEEVGVATATAGNLQMLQLASNGSFRGKPQVILDGEDGFGRLSGLDLVSGDLAIAGTVNKDGGQPVSSDDRVILIAPSGGNGSGGPD